MTDQDKAIRSALLTAKRAAGGPVYRELKIGSSTGCYTEHPEHFEIQSIRTPQAKRNVGGASAVMQRITDEADAAGKPVRLLASPLDKKTSTQQLVDFYRKRGFATTGEKGNYVGDPWMERAPALKQRAAGGPVAPPLQQRRQFIGSNMYSQAAEAAQALSQAKGQPQQMLASLKGVKPEEIANSGAAQAFAGQPSVTREQLVQHFQKSTPQIRETNLGNYHDDEDGDKPKFEEYTIPGGENYRELLMHTPPDRNTLEQHKVMRPDGHVDGTYANRASAEARAQQIGGQVQTAAPLVTEGGFRSSHWDVPNVVAHLRMSDRRVPSGKTPEPDQKIFDETMPGTPERRARLAEQERAKKGDKVLHLEELQSDWGQAGREKGFKDPKFDPRAAAMERNALLDRGRPGTWSPQDEARFNELDTKIGAHAKGVPSGPYITSTNGWTDLGLKRALTEAARGKYDRLAWTPGQEQGERYGLAKKIAALHYYDNASGGMGNAQLEGPPGAGTLHAYGHNGEEVLNKYLTSHEDAAGMIGKEMAKKLFDQEPTLHREAGIGLRRRALEGEDLQVGGEGMKGYYDKILPGRLKEILKKLGHEAKFEPLTIKHPKDDAGRTEHTLHSVPLPPELREKILKGLPAYAAGGSIVDHALRLTAPR